MTLQLTKSAIDLGIVITDSDRSLAFYRDLLGFRHEGDIPMPIGSGTMHRLWCGDSLIKLVKFDDNPDATAPPGGIGGASGMRYFTIHCSNIPAMAEAARAASVPIKVEPTEIREGVSIAIFADPDGNWVELVDAG
ncbi:MAG: VOC family protein [Acidimicrobiales bacterium]